jgi:hypothetical protein
VIVGNAVGVFQRCERREALCFPATAFNVTENGVVVVPNNAVMIGD